MATDTRPIEQEKQSSRLPPSLDEINASVSTMMTEQKEKEKEDLTLFYTTLLSLMTLLLPTERNMTLITPLRFFNAILVSLQQLKMPHVLVRN